MLKNTEAIICFILFIPSARVSNNGREFPQGEAIIVNTFIFFLKRFLRNLPAVDRFKRYRHATYRR